MQNDLKQKRFVPAPTVRPLFYNPSVYKWDY